MARLNILYVSSSVTLTHPPEAGVTIPPILEMRTPRPKIFHLAMVALFVNIRAGI